MIPSFDPRIDPKRAFERDKQKFLEQTKFTISDWYALLLAVAAGVAGAAAFRDARAGGFPTIARWCLIVAWFGAVASAVLGGLYIVQWRGRRAIRRMEPPPSQLGA